METKLKKFIKKNDLNGLATYVLSNLYICANGNIYRMIEIELYIYNNTHKDIFTHRHSKQSEFFIWYFHQMSERENSYKGGTYKGLDIACGFDGGYHGILIRAVVNLSDQTVIEGPCNVVNEILRQSEVDSIQELITDRLENNLSCTNPMLFIGSTPFDPTTIYTAPRIGLTLKGNNAAAKQSFINKHYRYIIFKDKIKKEKRKMIELAA